VNQRRYIPQNAHQNMNAANTQNNSYGRAGVQMANANVRMNNNFMGPESDDETGMYIPPVM
jgi:hypothetical protein